MHLFFVDESGTPPKPTNSQSWPHFVIAGLVMPATDWKGLADEFQSLKRKQNYRVSGEIKWRHFGERSADKENNVSHLTAEEKFSFRKEMFELVTKRESMKIISCVSHAPTAYGTGYVKDEEDLYEFTYKPITERFQYFLQGIGANEFGMIVSDHRGRKQDDRLRKHHNKLIYSSGSTTSDYANLIETLFLAPSNHSVGIQFADMIAGAIGRAFNSKDPTFARMLKPAFRKSPDGRTVGWGLVKFPAKWKAPGGGL
jgi:hypothetical protein